MDLVVNSLILHLFDRNNWKCDFWVQIISSFFNASLFRPWYLLLFLNALFKMMSMVSCVGLFVKSDSTSELTIYWSLCMVFSILCLRSRRYLWCWCWCCFWTRAVLVSYRGILLTCSCTCRLLKWLGELVLHFCVFLVGRKEYLRVNHLDIWLDRFLSIIYFWFLMTLGMLASSFLF